MALTESTMMPLGTLAPAFELPEPLSGQDRSLDELRGEKATLIVFMCNHCPYVRHVIDGVASLAHDYRPKGVSVVAINSNDVANYPEDAPDKMAAWAREKSFGFPYLYDETQAVAKAYRAACTPDFFLFDKNLACVYRGRLDGATPGNKVPVTGADLRAALDALLAGNPVGATQKPSMGCNIKWKA
jgi:thiol-disulfide isomerase/thioredoxin